MKSTLRNCPVCDFNLDDVSLDVTVLKTLRGRQPWAKCPRCRSFFFTEAYDLEREVEHTRTRPWGMAKEGIALGRDKSAMFATVLKEVAPYAPQGGVLLDIGCSFGGFLQLAQLAGYRVRGIDIVPEAIEHIRSLGIDCDHAASLADTNIPSGSLDMISVLDCNYYWSSQTRELRAIHSRLRPEGLLIMRVVDTSWAIQACLLLRRCIPGLSLRWCGKAVYDHRVSVPVGSLLKIVEREGFDVVYESQRDAMPFHRNSIKVRTAYAVGQIAWRMFGINLAPGFVFIARRRSL